MGAHGHDDAAQERDPDEKPPMIATREEMRRHHVPLQWRDNCAHLLIPLNECRHDTWYNPNKCMPERKAYAHCQDEEYFRRVRVATKRKKEEYWRQQDAKAAAEASVAEASAVSADKSPQDAPAAE